MRKISFIVFGLVLLCYSCNQNTGKATGTTGTDSVAVSESANQAEEDSTLKEVMELPFKK